MPTEQYVKPEDLRNAIPLRNLPERIIRYLCGQTKLERWPRGHKLFSAGDNTDCVYFLVEGNLKITSPEGGKRIIGAGTPSAYFPLAHECPCKQDAKAASKISVIRFERELLQNIERLNLDRTTQPNGRGVELVEDEMEDRLYVDFYCKLQDGEFELPSMPDIAVRIGKAINNPGTDSADIARIIQLDPALTARIIQVVNSPAYAGRSRIDSCPDAVTRLGRKVTRNLVISFVLKSLFRTRYKILQKRMTELWKHSRRVASLCHVLARMTPGLDPDRAMLAGIIHDIGAVPILSAARAYPELVNSVETLDKTVTRLRAEVGALVLRKWDFMEEFTEVALHAENWMRDEGERPDYTDLVVVSQLHAYVGTPQVRDLPCLDLTPAFHKLALGELTPRRSIQVLDDAKAEIQAVESLLE